MTVVLSMQEEEDMAYKKPSLKTSSSAYCFIIKRKNTKEILKEKDTSKGSENIFFVL